MTYYLFTLLYNQDFNLLQKSEARELKKYIYGRNFWRFRPDPARPDRPVFGIKKHLISATMRIIILQRKPTDLYISKLKLVKFSKQSTEPS